MAIIISKNDQNVSRVEESKVENESELQYYIAHHPDVIPLDQIKQDPEFFVVGMEVGTQSGPVDAIGLDSDGDIYLIETKLEQNSDKREIIAQIFDYAANIWKTEGSTEEFVNSLDTKVQELFGASLQQKVQQDFSIESDEANKVLTNMRANIDNGYFRFVICMDTLNDRLKNLILYLNQNSKFDVYAVEFEFYRHEDMQIVKPQLYGAQVKKSLTSSSANNRSQYTDSTESDFWSSVDGRLEDGSISNELRTALERLVETTRKIANETSGQVYFTHVENLDRTVVKLTLHDENDKISIYIDSDGSFSVHPRDKSGPQIDIIKIFNKKVVDAGVAERNKSHLTSIKWHTNLTASTKSNEELKTFADLFEESADEVLNGSSNK